jgi:hypothetical protein
MWETILTASWTIYNSYYSLLRFHKCSPFGTGCSSFEHLHKLILLLITINVCVMCICVLLIATVNDTATG